MTPDRLHLLDGFRLLHDGEPVPVPRGLQRIVAIVGLHPGATRGHLAGSLWPETSEERALSCLRTAIWRLRRSRCCPILAAGDTVRLDPVVTVDVDELIRSVSEVRAGADPRCAREVLAAGGYDLLPGWYEDWVLLDRERLRQLRLHALEELARAHLRAAEHGDALQAALEAMRAEPLRESPHRLIVEIHLAEGNAYEALHAFYVYRDLLRQDLAVEPSPTMCTLVADILGPITARWSTV
ncbi:AfsR/SARP family transcriptional regulator [Paractinoplanes globisporus]|uniref:BTAD domain-containing putative transcriptional regulator n=1 Tax=Paractinoplanes globisporus TaxID=113565 RepID=A0ABW6W6R1_9ACTN|nr:BTAD domain-containing putative transcriptional regulator [Actinoplanes globisporus]